MILPFPLRRNTRVLMMLVAVVLLFVIAAATATQLLSIGVPHGSPFGPSIRTGQYIVTLMETLQPYIPSLSRSGGNDRFRIGVFICPVDQRSPGRLLPIGGGFRANDSSTMKLLGGDGRYVWCHIKGLVGVDTRTGKIIRAEDLRRANPGLAESWDDTRRMTVEDRLRVASPDRQHLFELDPDTLRASPVDRSRAIARYPFELKPEDFLTQGAFPSTNEWLGLLSARDAERSYRPGSWVRRGTLADEGSAVRQLFRGTIAPAPQPSAYELLSLSPVPGEGLPGAAFLSSGADRDSVRLSNPEGFLLVYTASSELKGTLAVARVDLAGRLVWTIDTGLDRLRLRQILPDPRFPAFIGTRLPVPDKVSEPLLVIIDTQNGTAATNTLWK